LASQNAMEPLLNNAVATFQKWHREFPEVLSRVSAFSALRLLCLPGMLPRLYRDRSRLCQKVATHCSSPLTFPEVRLRLSEGHLCLAAGAAIHGLRVDPVWMPVFGLFFLMKWSSGLTLHGRSCGRKSTQRLRSARATFPRGPSILGLLRTSGKAQFGCSSFPPLVPRWHEM